MSDETNGGFWEQRPRGPEVVRGRYRMPDPVTGEERDWTRVTNFNKTYADSYGLDRWKLYQLLVGLHRRPDLLAQVRVLDEDDRREMSEITDTALAAAETERAANEGKAAHRALALADLGQPFPEEWSDLVAAYRRELARCGLAVVPGMVEVTVLNRDLGVAGTGDRFYVDRAGRVVLGDLKSGRLDRAELEHRIQFACYGTATHYRVGDDGSWRPMPTGEQAVRDDVAVLVKVDLEQRSVSVYQVDLVAGRRSANLARTVREDRRLGGTLLPYVPPPTADKGRQDTVIDGSRRVVDGVEEVYQLGQWMALSPSEQNGQARHLQVVPPLGQVVSGAPVGEVRIRPDGVAVRWNGQVWVPEPGPSGHFPSAAPASPVVGLPPQVPGEPPSPMLAPLVPPPDPNYPPPGQKCPTCSGVPQTRTALKKLDKAGLQALCKAHGVTENLAKNKDPLIDYLRDAGHVDGEEPATRRLDTAPDPSDPQAVAGPIGGQDPADPRSPAFTQMFLRRIELAATIAELGRVHAEVTRLGGQQAWTPEIDEAARRHAAAIEAPGDGPAYRAATGAPQEPASAVAIAGPLDLIAQAESQEDLGGIWKTVTLGGTQPERWTEEVGRAAQARLEIIQSRPPAVAVNPFAHTPGVTS